ncbi:MAG TPA: hypothetical protein VEU33_06500 [Archangium sp.]|nr:hypothetical protein [Archangium sp.]
MAFFDWIVLAVLLLWVCVFALVAFVPWASRWFPAAATFGWPYATLGLLLLGGPLLLGLGLIWLISRFWSNQETIWASLVREWSGLRILDWLWPWLPVLLVTFTALFLAAYFLSRRYFHFAVLGVLACGVLGVALHDEPVPVPTPEQHLLGVQGYMPQILLSEGRPLDGSRAAAPLPSLPPLQLWTPYVWEPGRDARWELSRHRGRLVSAEPVQEELEFTRFLGGRLQKRVIEPTLHASQVTPDPVFLAVLGLLIILGYRTLEGVNARRNLPGIEIGALEDLRQVGNGGAAGGNGRRAHEIEQLLMKHLRESSPHIPPRVPGGSPLYWESLMEAQEARPDTWYSKILALLMHFFLQASRLRLMGTIVSQQKPGEGTRVGLRIELTDARTHEIRFVGTFCAESAETAAQQAAYAVAEVAMEHCPSIPEWASLRRTEGKALMRYKEGLANLHLDLEPHPLLKSQNVGPTLEKAHKSFEAAARLNHGNANMKIQFAEILELENQFVGAMLVYLETFQRYPRVLLAKYRFGIACSYVDSWLPSLIAQGADGRELWARLQNSLDPPRRRAGRFHRLWARFQQVFTGKPLEMRRIKALDPWEPQHTEEILRFFLELSEQTLGEVLRAIDFKVIFWLRNIEDRRLFLAAVAWPPRLQRATRAALIAARCCALLRLKPHALDIMVANKRLLRRLLQVERRAELLAGEALRATRLRGRFWGLAHYNLACFFALRLRDELRNPSPQAAPDVPALQAITHLKRSIQDPEGPFASSEGTFASGTLWWVQQDPSLEALRSAPSAYWKAIQV